MKKTKKAKLEANGWRVGSAKEFLGLSDEEMRVIDVKIKLVQLHRKQRMKKGLTQHALAEKIHTSQSRIAKLEQGKRNISTDLILKSLYAMGTPSELIAESFTNAD